MGTIHFLPQLSPAEKQSKREEFNTLLRNIEGSAHILWHDLKNAEPHGITALDKEFLAQSRHIIEVMLHGIKNRRGNS
jgi:hypothetical protein